MRPRLPPFSLTPASKGHDTRERIYMYVHTSHKARRYRYICPPTTPARASATHMKCVCNPRKGSGIIGPMREEPPLLLPTGHKKGRGEGLLEKIKY